MKYVNVVYLGGGWGYFEKGRIHTNHFKRPLPQKKTTLQHYLSISAKEATWGEAPVGAVSPPWGVWGGH